VSPEATKALDKAADKLGALHHDAELLLAGDVPKKTLDWLLGEVRGVTALIERTTNRSNRERFEE
jgi:hypothetical protein